METSTLSRAPEKLPLRPFGHSPRGGRIAFAALALGALLTVAASAYVSETTRKERQEYFERRTAETRALLVQHLRLHTEVLRGLQGLFLQAGERPVSRDEFRRYVDHLNLDARYPGIQALSFTRYVRDSDLAAFEAEIRGDPAIQRADFTVRKPAGRRTDYFVADYLRPETIDNTGVFGLDLGAEPVRRAAFERARDTGLPAVSERIRLTMREDGPPGFLVAAPIYRSEARLLTVEDRRRAFLGCVTAVFRSKEMMTGLFGAKLLGEIDIEIFDFSAGDATEGLGGRNLLFDSGAEIAGRDMPLHAAVTAAGLRKVEKVELLADRQWTTVYTALPAMDAADSGTLLAGFVLLGGGALTLLLFALLASISNANRRLESEVGERTAALTASNAELRQSVAELTVAHRDLEAAQGQLLQAEKMSSLGQLAAGVAHEINNPVGFINSNLFTLRQQVADLRRVLDAYAQAEAHIASPEIRSELAAVRNEADLEFVSEDIEQLIRESIEGAQRVRKIVADLKDFSRTDSGEWGFMNVEHGIDSTLTIVWNEIKYKAEVVKEYGGVPEIECLGSQLNQVFMNLLVNAAHAIEKRGTITVRTGADDENVWVEVADTGEGIPPENLKRIFDPFFTTKPVGRGTGLGLSLVHGIVKRHRGTIDVDSVVGRGSSFRVTIPRRRVAEQPAA